MDLITQPSNWVAFVASLAGKTENALLDSWFSRLCLHYSEPTRHYHTLNHIHHMLTLLEEHKSHLQSKERVAMAIWFHDVIYDPTKNDNEEKSEELWKVFAKEASISSTDTEIVSQYILATKSHKIPEHLAEDQDLKYFMDFDLAILGSDAATYEQYAANIRKEYSWVPEDKWIAGRPNVLRSLMAGDVYFTEAFKKFEAAAKENMTREIERITAGAK
eukprot:TRINITY_DN6462_c0_g1_i1.p1 TRINITY_DN6462_c0_g1~~TRINITY_DN6462_c0_g1_i1.p1  ORF type:complete len:218 (+),score=29.01 TRINITY_DN6462_c0_g1_i1:109-762(+)